MPSVPAKSTHQLMAQKEEVIDSDDTCLQDSETAVDTEIMLLVVSYFADSRVARRDIVPVTVKPNATWNTVRELYVNRTSFDMNLVTLWLPNEPLDPPNAPEMLNSRLLQGDGSLEPLCDLLKDDVKVFDTFRQLRKRPIRNSFVSPIVARIDHLPRAMPSPVALQQPHLDLVQRFDESKVLPISPSQYRSYQAGSQPILDGRFVSAKPLLPGPVHMYHPVFSWFAAAASDESIEVSDETVLATEALMDHVSQLPDEDQLSTREMLQDVWHATEDPCISWIADSAYSRCLVIVEDELEPGRSEPSEKVMAKAEFRYMARQLEEPGHLRSGSCPAFLITMVGPYLSVCGAIWTTDVIVQHLLPGPVWLGCPNRLAESKIVGIARMLIALARAVLKLETHNKLVLSDVVPPINVARFFPGATSYRDQASKQIVHFQYEAYLAGNQPSCLVFLATTVPSDDSEAPRKIVVKFAERYGEAAHRLLAERNMAPALLYCGDIWAEDPVASRGCGSLRMIVMEYFEGRHALFQDLAALKAAEQAIKVLHNEHIVHGDVRLPNILVGPDGTMKLIDFDWAGEEGIVRYPIRVDTHIVNAPGVRPYGKIEAAHDRAMLQRYIGPR